MFDKILGRQYLVKNEKTGLYACVDPTGWGKKAKAKKLMQETASEIARILSLMTGERCQVVHEDDCDSCPTGCPDLARADCGEGYGLGG